MIEFFVCDQVRKDAGGFGIELSAKQGAGEMLFDGEIVGGENAGTAEHLDGLRILAVLHEEEADFVADDAAVLEVGDLGL